MFVLTVDQQHSRSHGDRVEVALAALGPVSTRLPFSRTVGDELQGALDDPLSVVTAILVLVRSPRWHVGLGIGPVQQPLPDDVRAARGPAFLAARTAVERAKRDPTHLCVEAAGPGDVEGQDAEAVLQLLATLLTRRSPEGWAAVDEVRSTGSRTAAAARLGISRQAVGQRLQAAGWTAEQRVVPTLVRLLAAADAAAAGSEVGA